MANKEDLRVRRTKAALAEAFVKLLKEKKLDDITINELCDTAGIRRATFYKHYEDKFDFLRAYIWGLRDAFDKLFWKSNKPLNSVDYYSAYARSVIEHIDKNEAAVNNLLDSDIFPYALSIIIEQNFIDTCERMKVGVENGMKPAASVEVVAGIFAGGVTSVIYVWLRNGKPIPASELADQVSNVIHSSLRT